MPKVGRVLGWSLFVPLFVGASLFGALGFALDRGSPASTAFWAVATLLGLLGTMALLQWARHHVRGRYY